jgi:hypothetical protein
MFEVRLHPHPLPSPKGVESATTLLSAPAKLYNEGSLLLPEGSVCALGHKAHQSTKEALNFGELR